ncbi:acyl-CoA dehydrogenase family protein [Thiomicrorhabdus chilensis]|uniref:hypothetical protein n=1 Tax=Thiomicrorhabdus chilensis TaxID=63656 RepID=UPI00041919EC|nr:hypothetical protein [Thiomicrorhabdus chilensis]
MTKHSAPQSLLDSVTTILPIIEQNAQKSEQLGHLTDEVLDALFEQRLFRLFIPQEYNGEATDLPTALKVFERVASADGATGWLVMIGAGGGLFSGFLQEDAARQIFSPERAVIAGSGMPSGIASSTKKGFEVSGRWAYASGAYHASWFTANCKVDGDDNEITAIAVPAEQVTIHDTWSVFGMQATGSHDFSLDSFSVAPAYTLSLFDEPLLDEPIFRCPLETLASLSFASVAIGIAQHALNEFNDFAQHKRPAGSSHTLAETSEIQRLCDQNEHLISNARDSLYGLAQQVWVTAEAGEVPCENLLNQVQQMGIENVQACLKAVDQLKAHAGMRAVFTDSALGRAWRDLHVLSQHVIVTPKIN